MDFALEVFLLDLYTKKYVLGPSNTFVNFSEVFYQVSSQEIFGYRLDNSDNLLLSIQEKIMWADSMSDQDRQHKKEVEDKVDEVRKSTKVSPVLELIILNSKAVEFAGNLHVHSTWKGWVRKAS